MMDFSQLFVNIMYFIAEINTISQSRATFVIAVDGKWRFCFYFVLVSMIFYHNVRTHFVRDSKGENY